MHPSYLDSAAFHIVRALTMQVRVLSHDQIARAWFTRATTTASSSAQDVVEELITAKLIQSQHFEVHPLLPLRHPLFAWEAGTAAPTDDQLRLVARESQRRWKDAYVDLELLTATKRAHRMFGTFVDTRHLKLCEVTHDYHLAEVYVRRVTQQPASARQWRGEGGFPKLGLAIRGLKDPDAFLLNRDGEAERIIEFAGSYDEEHILRFHRHCAGDATQRVTRYFQRCPQSPLRLLYGSRGTSYELW